MRLFSNFIGQRQRLRVLTPADHEILLKWMELRPAQAAFAIGWLMRFGMSGAKENAFFDFFVKEADGEWLLVALVVHGALIHVMHGDEKQGADLGRHFRRKHASFQTLVGVDAAIEGLTRELAPQGEDPRVLQHQRLMLWSKPDVLPPHVPFGPLRSARLDDLTKVTNATLAMHEEEVGAPNSESDIDALMRSSYQKVKEGRVWIVDSDDGSNIVFKASISLPTDVVAQVEGIWTAPALRGKGLATRCLQDICHQLFQRYAHLSLSVAVDNHTARRLYAKLGFVDSVDWRTVYLDDY